MEEPEELAGRAGKRCKAQSYLGAVRSLRSSRKMFLCIVRLFCLKQIITFNLFVFFGDGLELDLAGVAPESGNRL